MIRILFSVLFCAGIVFPQKLSGIIYGEFETNFRTPLPGVNIFWADTELGTMTDTEGKFQLYKTSADTSLLVVTYVSFKPDTIKVAKTDEYVEIILKENRELNAVEITARSKSISISDLNPILTMEITRDELKKAACCNLSESFETNASVDVSYSDAVTGAKQIKLLGLAGKYSQIMTENIPNIRGLASVYGLYYIPGPWMQSIQISKGTASVVNGYESVSGQINIEFKKPMQSEKYYADIFTNSELKSDFNANTYYEISPELTTGVLFHAEYFNRLPDNNNDGFIDNPNIRQINLLNRWEYTGLENWHIAASFSYLNDKRHGGQGGFNKPASSGIYKTEMDANRFQGWSKIGYMFNNDKNTSIGFINMITSHRYNSAFGMRKYDAKEFSYYSNLILESNVFNEQHKISSGLSLVYDDYQENLENNNYDNTETVPGAFFQYTFSPDKSFSVIGGIRADNHNKYGLFFTPRLHIKYSPFENTNLRIAAGKGFRTARIISENIPLITSSRKFIFEKNPEMEEAVNYGINITQYITINERALSISADFYRTDFLNKIVVDLDKSSKEVNFYNLSGKSYANNYQLELSYELFPQFDVLGAVRFSETKTDYVKGLRSEPLNNQFKGLLSFSYLTNLRLWQFDFTAQFNGKSRLPDFSDNPEINMRKYSPNYTILNAQITRFFKGWEVYLGAENLTGYTQTKPIISSDNPFGDNFDASVIWGPVSGRMFYMGARFSIN